MTSKNLVNDNGGQSELLFLRVPQKAKVPMEMVRAKKSAGAAFTLACDTSGLDDKEIYIPLGIDAGTFSRIKSGKNSLAPDLLKRFCDVVGNTVYPEWLVYQIGYGLVMLKSEAERRAEEAERRAQEAERRVAWLTELLQGKK